MRCHYCGYPDSKVIDSRTKSNGSVIRRRRECLSCKRRFTTKELIEETPLIVVMQMLAPDTRVISFEIPVGYSSVNS